jgi:hypothetical protein
LELLDLIMSAIDHIITVFGNAFIAGMNIAEDGLRVPLQHIGVVGPAQTAVVALVPILSLIAAIYLLRGVIRLIVAFLLLSFSIHALWPLVSGHLHAL